MELEGGEGAYGQAWKVFLFPWAALFIPEEGTCPGCAQAGIHRVPVHWSIVNSVPLHTYLLKFCHVFVPMPSLVKALAGWWGQGPDKQTIKWRDLCWGQRIQGAHPITQVSPRNCHPSNDGKDDGSH